MLFSTSNQDKAHSTQDSGDKVEVKVEVRLKCDGRIRIRIRISFRIKEFIIKFRSLYCYIRINIITICNQPFTFLFEWIKRGYFTEGKLQQVIVNYYSR